MHDQEGLKKAVRKFGAKELASYLLNNNTQFKTPARGNEKSSLLTTELAIESRENKEVKSVLQPKTTPHNLQTTNEINRLKKERNSQMFNVRKMESPLKFDSIV
jgi:hypothetical protein